MLAGPSLTFSLSNFNFIFLSGISLIFLRFTDWFIDYFWLNAVHINWQYSKKKILTWLKFYLSVKTSTILNRSLASQNISHSNNTYNWPIGIVSMHCGITLGLQSRKRDPWDPVLPSVVSCPSLCCHSDVSPDLSVASRTRPLNLRSWRRRRNSKRGQRKKYMIIYYWHDTEIYL